MPQPSGRVLLHTMSGTDDPQRRLQWRQATARAISASKVTPCCASCWWRLLKQLRGTIRTGDVGTFHLAMRRHKSIAKVATHTRSHESARAHREHSRVVQLRRNQ